LIVSDATSTTITLAGTVKKLIEFPGTAQQAHISLSGAEYLYDELRVANIHKWPVGSSVEVVIKPR
jgi:hypothetical protein